MLLTETVPAAPPVGTVPPRRRPDIQGLRAVAVLAVVLYHAAGLVPGGFVGVDVFFVVSGFVITGLLTRELAATGRIRLAGFYLRRARRLLPAYALLSLITLAGAALLLSPVGGGQQAAGRAAAYASAFAGNVYFYIFSGAYFQPVAESNPFLHTWSLSVEEQFYLAFPALLLLGWWLRRRWRGGWLPGLLAAALLLSLAASVCLSYGRAPHWPGIDSAEHAARLAFYSPLTRAWEFLAGALLAVAPARYRPRPGAARLLSVAGAGLLAAAVVLLRPDDPVPGILAAVPVAATGCLLLAGNAARPAMVSRVLSSAPAVRLGDLSYSWYLWHWPAIVFARTWYPGRTWVPLAAALAAMVPAVLSYHLIERPIHRGRRLPSRRATVLLAAGCVALP
ncbi:MAG TPA: acyltransferase, partial [Rugosimonospora sp.]|nr:acyltransferase [Rugosimonospora sp.]